MLVHLRRISTVVAAVLVGLGLVVLDPHAPAALAFQSPPPLTWNPSQVTEVPNTLDPAQWNKALTNAPDRVISNPASAGSGLSKVGGTLNGVAGAIGAATVGVTVGTWIADMVGLPTSGSFLCDLGTAFAGSDCALGPSEAYTVNGDVGGGRPAGWLHGNVASQYYTEATGNRYWHSGLAVGMEVLSAPAFRAPAGTVSVAMTYAGTWQPFPGSTADPYAVMTVWAVFTNTTTGVFYGQQVTGTSSCTWSGGGTTQTCTLAVSSPGAVFDHLEVLVGRDRFLAGPVTPLPYWPTIPGLDWYPEGHEDWVPAQSPDPQRWWRSTWQCSAGAPGGTRTSDPWHETDPEWPGFPQAECSPGSVVTSLLVEQITEGLDGSTVVFDWTASQGYQDWANSNCVGGGCQLVLQRIDQVTGARVSCFSNPTLCASWAEDPAREENYECTYGGSAVPLTDCLVYAPTFQPGGANYADPQGNVDPDAGTDPGTDPGSDPGSEDCPPPFSWTNAFNPWWYYKSTLCALENAFVPTQSQVKVEQIGQALQTKTPVPELGSISQALAPPSAGSECLVLSLPIAFVIGHDQPLLDSCTWSDPVSRLLRDYRPLFTVVVWFTVIAPLAWWAWKTYAPGSTGTA